MQRSIQYFFTKELHEIYKQKINRDIFCLDEFDLETFTFVM